MVVPNRNPLFCLPGRRVKCPSVRKPSWKPTAVLGVRRPGRTKRRKDEEEGGQDPKRA